MIPRTKTRKYWRQCICPAHDQFWLSTLGWWLSKEINIGHKKTFYWALHWPSSKILLEVKTLLWNFPRLKSLNTWHRAVLAFLLIYIYIYIYMQLWKKLRDHCKSTSFSNFTVWVTIMCWETLFLNWWTVCPHWFSQRGEPRCILACKRLWRMSL